MCYFPLHGWDCTLKIKSPSIYSILSHRRRIVPVPLGFTSLSDSAALYQNRTTNRELSKWMYSRRVMKLNYTYRLIIHSLVSIPSRCHNILYIHLHLHLWFYLANIYILNLGCQNSKYKQACFTVIVLSFCFALLKMQQTESRKRMNAYMCVCFLQEIIWTISQSNLNTDDSKHT